MKKFRYNESLLGRKSSRNYQNIKIEPYICSLDEDNFYFMESVGLKTKSLSFKNVENLEIFLTRTYSPVKCGILLNEIIKTKCFEDLKSLKITSDGEISFHSLVHWNLNDLREFYCGSGVDEKVS